MMHHRAETWNSDGLDWDSSFPVKVKYFEPVSAAITQLTLPLNPLAPPMSGKPVKSGTQLIPMGQWDTQAPPP